MTRTIQCKRCRNLGHIHYFKDYQALDQHITVKHGVRNE